MRTFFQLAFVSGLLLLNGCSESSPSVLKKKSRAIVIHTNEDAKRFLYVRSKGHVEKIFFRNMKSIALSSRDMQELSKFDNLRSLEMKVKSLPPNSLKALAAFHDLERLTIYVKSGLADSDLTVINEMPKLEWLALSNGDITDEGLSVLAAPRLRYLSIASPYITGEFLKPVGKKMPLRSLNLYHSGLVDENVGYINQFRKLTFLWVRGTQVTDEGLKSLVPNHCIVNFNPTENMTTNALLQFRTDLLRSRTAARERGEVVPPDDTLFIQASRRYPEVRGEPLKPGYSKELDRILSGSE